MYVFQSATKVISFVTTRNQERKMKQTVPQMVVKAGV